MFVTNVYTQWDEFNQVSIRLANTGKGCVGSPSWTAYTLRRRQHNLLKHQVLITQWHSVTTQKTWILRNLIMS